MIWTINASLGRVGRARRYTLLAGFLFAVAACRTWQPAGPVGTDVPMSTQVMAAAGGKGEQPVRLTTHRGDVLILQALRVERDSVVGTATQDRVRRAVALADVHRVEAYRIGAAATAGAVIAGVLGALAVLYAVTAMLVVRGT